MAKRGTIAAPVTPSGMGAIAVVEIAGPEAARIVEKVFCARLPAEGCIAYGRLRDETGRRIEEVLVECIGESHYAINGHGGEAACRAILELLCRGGAVRAGPEAFIATPVLPEKLDAVQRTALVLLQTARTRRAAVMLLSQVRGALSRALRDAAQRADAALLDRLLAGADAAIRLVDPPRVAIVGPPNAGKSSLANALHRRDRSIVTELPGTTLDPIEALAVIDDYPIHVIDTAGNAAGPPGSPVAMAAEAARKKTACADLLLYVIDLLAGPGEEDIARICGLRRVAPLIAVLNKADLSGGAAAQRGVGDMDCMVISCADGRGIDHLRDRIVSFLFAGLPAEPSSAAVFTPRQKDAIIRARAALDGPGGAAGEIVANLLAVRE